VTAAAPARGSGAGPWIGALLAVAALVAFLVLSSQRPSGDPFDIRSAAPDGYKALSILLERRGADVGRSTAARALDEAPSPGQVLVVADPDLLSDREVARARSAADAGAVVVFGRQRESGVSADEFGLTGAPRIDARTLADTPAEPVEPGRCDIAELAGLGAVDSAFADRWAVEGQQSCYGRGLDALVLRRPVGRGAIITLGSPYLWSNARLQPDKEHGGAPLDNAVVALRLLGPTAAGATDGTRITFVDAVPSAGVSPTGQQSPIALLPLPVQLAVVQLVAAFVLYAWWRARRLGAPVRERVPVEIAGSELVAAVGDLLRRRGSPDRAAVVLRADVRRDLARRLGIPPDAPPASLVAVVAARTGRPTDEVAAALSDGPVASAESLVRLTHTLDAIRQEVLHGHPVA
jgi:hypothetical protein